jgi:hypothetical protein
MDFKPISEPYVLGIECTNGARTAQVCRSEAGEWTTFCYWQGLHISTGESKTYSYQSAKRQARAFVNFGQLTNGLIFDPLFYDVNNHKVYVRRGNNGL